MGIKTVPQPPYSPDLAPCDFWLFHMPRGCRYETTGEIREAVTKVIDTLTQEDFHGAFQKLLERYNKCIAAGGDYFEGELSFICVLSIKILLAYGLPKTTVAAIMILYRNTKVKVRSPDGDIEYFDIVAGVLQGDTLAPYLFIICLDYVLRTSIDKIRENVFELTKKRSRRYPATTITDADYADDIAILANIPNQAETLLHSLERAAAGIGLHVNAHNTEYMCYNQTGDISTLDGTPLKLIDKFTYLGSRVSSTEKDIDTQLTKAWTVINRLSIKWKSDLADKMKRSFFQAAVVSILLYGCTTWTLTKRLEKLDSNYTRMLRAILNKSWRQHPTRHQLYGHLPPITKTILARRTRHAGDVLLWTPTYGRAKAGRPA